MLFNIKMGVSILDSDLAFFLSGIPGCAKSALCKEILNTPGGLGDDRPLHSLMGDLIKGTRHQMLSSVICSLCLLE